MYFTCIIYSTNFLRNNFEFTDLKYTSSLEGASESVEIELRLISELHPTDNDYVHVSILFL